MQESVFLVDVIIIVFPIPFTRVVGGVDVDAVDLPLVSMEQELQGVTAALEAHPLVAIERAEVSDLDQPGWDNVIVATGPLTSETLAGLIRARTGEAAARR